MNQSPSYIHFRVQWQVLGPQSPGQRFERERFQKFFESLNSDRQFQGYDDFSYRPDRCEMAKARGAGTSGGEAFSKVVYSSDALSVVEEWTDESASDFAKKLKVVLDRWFACFPETLAVMQTCAIRALVQPSNFADSRDFIGTHVLRLHEGLEATLTGSLDKVGFTLSCQRKQGVIPMTLECVASSWRDNRSVWVEVRGLAALSEPLNAVRHDQSEAIFGRCRDFLENELLRLLLYYDRR